MSRYDHLHCVLCDFCTHPWTCAENNPKLLFQTVEDRHWWWNQCVHLQMSMFQLKNCQCQWTKVASEVRSTSTSVPFVFLDSHTVVHKNFFSSGVSLKFLRENIQSKQPELCFMPLCCLAPAHRWHFLITPHIINISVPIRCIPNFGLTGLNLNLLKYSVWDCRLCQETACLKFTVSSCNHGHVCFVASVCS